MSWLRLPERLFAATALALLVTRVAFPPSDSGAQLNLNLDVWDLHINAAGYGAFDFSALILGLSALIYYGFRRFSRYSLNPALGQLHFWFSFGFVSLMVYMAHRVNRISKTDAQDPAVLSAIHPLQVGLTWTYIIFIFLPLIMLAYGLLNLRIRTRTSEVHESR